MQNQTQPVFSHTGPASTCQAQLQKKRTKSPRKRQGGRRRGKGRERESRQSPGWLFLCIVNGLGFLSGAVETPHHYSVHRGKELHGGCPVGLLSQGVYVARGWRKREEKQMGVRDPCKNEGQECRKKRQCWTKQLHWYKNTKWEQRVGRKYREMQPEALAPWTSSSASWWLLLCHPWERQSGFPKVIYHNLCRRS